MRRCVRNDDHMHQCLAGSPGVLAARDLTPVGSRTPIPSWIPTCGADIHTQSVVTQVSLFSSFTFGMGLEFDRENSVMVDSAG